MNDTPEKKKPGEFNIRFVFPDREEIYNLPYVPRQGEFVLCANNKKYRISEVTYVPNNPHTQDAIVSVTKV